MKEKISYQTEEGQNFQETPHVALLLSSQSPEKWQVDLRWREDDDPVNLDAQHSLAEGLTFNEAIEESKKWGGLLNVPVAKYEDNLIEILCKPKNPPSKEQKISLQSIMYSNKTQKFPTH